MYLSYPNLHTITRRNLDGTNVETLLTLSGTERPFGMELFAGRMYWCDNDYGLLRSATTGGANVKTILSGLSSPRAVSVGTFIAPLAGDFNDNGIVDAADYVVWRKTDGTQAGYNAWRTHFGQPSGAGNGAAGTSPFQGAVPECSSALLLILGAALGTLKGHRIAFRVRSAR